MIKMKELSEAAMMTNQYSIPLPVVIVGGGGHAKVLADAIEKIGANLIGYTDMSDTGLTLQKKAIQYMGTDEDLLKVDPLAVLLVNGIGSVNLPTKRKAIFDCFRRQGYRFATVVHPTAVIGGETILGEGAQVMAGVVLQADVTIGQNVIVNTHATIDHECIIGDDVHIAPGTVLSGRVKIGALSHIGTGVVVIQDIHIGERVLVSAGSVVTKNIEDGATVMGVPAKTIMKQGIWNIRHEG